MGHASMTDPLTLARRLIDAGMPVFVCKPDLDGRTASGRGTGYTLPMGWQDTPCTARTLDAYADGDGLAGVCGHALDVIDVDPRNGGDVAASSLHAAGAWPRQYLRVVTPSGGYHSYIYRLGVGKSKRDGIDHQGGTPGRRGDTDRGFAFLPGTVRVSKATGAPAPYILIPSMDELDTFGADDDTGAAFRGWLATRSAPSGTLAISLGGGPAFDSVIPQGRHDDTLTAYAARVTRYVHDPDEATALVVARGQACVPPWDEARRKHGGETLAVRARQMVESAIGKYGQALEPDGVDPVTGERTTTTWAPMDPNDPDSARVAPPAFLRRSDGPGLLYAGETNGLIGESESGKSWVAQYAAAQAMRAGLPCLYVDFESRYGLVLERLELLGVSRETLRELLRYARPDEPLALAAERDRDEAARWAASGLIVVDGVNAAMDVVGLDSNSTNDATKFHRDILAPFAASGAAVVYVDHIPKTSIGQATRGAIGSQAKRAMTTGAIIKASKVKELGRGKDGAVALYVDKDRPGHVRGAIPTGKENVALFLMDSTLLGGIDCRVIAPSEQSEFAASDRLATMRGAILAFVRDVGETSVNQIEKNVTGKSGAVRDEVGAMIGDGALVRELNHRGVAIVRLADAS